jgi:uncharacterized RDD family membrane protein YckC
VTQQPFDQMPQVPQVPQVPQYPQASAAYQMQQPAFQLATAPDGRPLANVGKRLLARIIDGLITFVLLVGLGGIIVGLGTALVAYLTDSDSPFIPIYAITTGIIVVIGSQYWYEVELPLRRNGQTPGKSIMKMAIAPLQPGARLTRGQLAGRYGLLWLANILSNCYIGLLDPLWCLWDKPYKQCLHDKPVRTVVVSVDPADVAAVR